MVTRSDDILHKDIVSAYIESPQFHIEQLFLNNPNLSSKFKKINLFHLAVSHIFQSL